MTAETKAHALALYGTCVAAILSTLGVWYGPWIIFGLQAITLFLCFMRDRAAGEVDEVRP